MNRSEEVELSSVQLIPEFKPYNTGEKIVWVPDAINLKLRRQSESGEITEMDHSNTSLEHILLLFDLLNEEQTGVALWGSSGIEVSFSGNEVVLSHKGINLVGSLDSAQSAVENLIKEVFEELRRQGVDTHETAQQLQDGRFASRTTNPVDFHDRLVD